MQSEDRITKMLQENKRFLDKRSRVVRDPSDLSPHLELHGQDISAQRELVMRRARGRCEFRHGKHRCPARWGLEMDHIQGGLIGRCSCLHNLQMLCHAHHEAKHGRTIRNPKLSVSQTAGGGAADSDARSLGGPAEGEIQ